MKDAFKKRLDKAKQKNKVSKFDKLVPEENRDYLPKREGKREPVAPTKFRQQYKCDSCSKMFEDFVGMFGGYNNPICPACKKSRGYE